MKPRFLFLEEAGLIFVKPQRVFIIIDKNYKS